MATLREQRREKRLQEILQTALEVLGEKGHQASMDQIAERALLTRVALYKYFPDKSSLLHAIRDWKIGQLNQQVRGALGTTPTFPEQLKIIVRECLDFQIRNPAFFRILLSGQEPRAGEAFEEFIGLVVEKVARAIKAKTIRPAPAESLAGMLITLCFQPAIKRHIVFGEDHSIEPNMADQIVELFLHGVENMTTAQQVRRGKKPR